MVMNRYYNIHSVSVIDKNEQIDQNVHDMI